eukprot:2228922-Alexandrium_andersonii.AAC.1
MASHGTDALADLVRPVVFVGAQEPRGLVLLGELQEGRLDGLLGDGARRRGPLPQGPQEGSMGRDELRLRA